ncbi:MAG TPA: wax ester/triacylglycerol synthase family O-acyltransferase [Acidimicrobiales bacterium]|nr:wax ester/triacylglycerol synthase family O-acyltransferase [Acidimicrobiales bacterium]
MEQLGGLDSAFIYCETPAMHLHVCGLLLLDPTSMPGGYAFEKIRAIVVDRMPAVPAARRKLATVPFGISRPYWIDDPDLDMDRHLFCVRAPTPGDDVALAATVGEIASRPLPRDRPLWEMSVVEGLNDDRIAIVVKMHHATIDGVSGANLMGQLFDLEPVETRTFGDQELGRPSRTPNPLALLGHGLVSRLAEPWELATLVPATTWRALSIVWRLAHRRKNEAALAAPFSAPRTLFNATITPRRAVAFTDIALADVKSVKNALGVTVNDVVTAVVGGALRRYLDDRGDLPEHSLLAAEPVSVHDQVGGEGTTKLSVMFSTLATDEEDPLERLRAIAAANARAKEIQRLVGADTLLRWSEHFWFNAIGLGARLYSTLHVADHHPVVHNLILSNVPGPPVPLYLAGARLVGLYPLGPITDGAGLNITVLSQEDRVGIGMITCPELVPRVWDLTDAIPGALDELVEAATRACG